MARGAWQARRLSKSSVSGARHSAKVFIATTWNRLASRVFPVQWLSRLASLLSRQTASLHSRRHSHLVEARRKRLLRAGLVLVLELLRKLSRIPAASLQMPTISLSNNSSSSSKGGSVHLSSVTQGSSSSKINPSSNPTLFLETTPIRSLDLRSSNNHNNNSSSSSRISPHSHSVLTPLQYLAVIL